MYNILQNNYIIIINYFILMCVFVMSCTLKIHVYTVVAVCQPIGQPAKMSYKKMFRIVR